MKTSIGHIQINSQAKNQPFYKELFTFLGWKVLYEDDEALGMGEEGGSSLWFIARMKELDNDYDGTGMNHLGIQAESTADVDEALKWIEARGIPALFDTPRHRPEYAGSDENDYYQIMFESPDKVLLEVVYWGPKE